MPAKKVNVRAQKMQRQTDRQAGSQAGRAVDSSARALFLLFRPWLALHTSLWHATAHVGGARPGSLDWATGQPHALSLSLSLSHTHSQIPVADSITPERICHFINSGRGLSGARYPFFSLPACVKRLVIVVWANPSIGGNLQCFASRPAIRREALIVPGPAFHARWSNRPGVSHASGAPGAAVAVVLRAAVHLATPLRHYSNHPSLTKPSNKHLSRPYHAAIRHMH